MSFFDLPVEVRLQIYNLVLSATDAEISYLFLREGFVSKFKSKVPIHLQAQLLLVSRKVHHEASPILYESPLFSTIRATQGIEQLQAKIGLGNLKLVRKLYIDANQVRDLATGKGEWTLPDLELLQFVAHSITVDERPLELITNRFTLRHIQSLQDICDMSTLLLQKFQHLKSVYQDTKPQAGSFGDGRTYYYRHFRTYDSLWSFAGRAREGGSHGKLLDIPGLHTLAYSEFGPCNDCRLHAKGDRKCEKFSSFMTDLDTMLYPDLERGRLGEPYLETI